MMTAPGPLMVTVQEMAGVYIAAVSGGTPPYTLLWSDGSEGNQLIAPDPGSYTVYVTDGSGCIAAADVLVPVGISELRWNMDWVQASGGLVWSGACSVDDIQVLDLSGRMIFSRPRAGFLPTPAWPGCYLLRYRCPDGWRVMRWLVGH